MGSHRVGHDRNDLADLAAYYLLLKIVLVLGEIFKLGLVKTVRFSIGWSKRKIRKSFSLLDSIRGREV